MLGPQIRKSALAVVCRSLATLLHSGVPVIRALEVAGRKSRDPRCERALADMSELVRQGEEISEAMSAQVGRFPTLMIDMVRMSEHSGALPEVLEHLAEHFENTVRLRRQFLSQITWPVVQFVIATLVIALLIVVLGMIPGGEALAEVTFGLRGVGGAIAWLAIVYGIVGLLAGGYLLAARTIAARRVLDRFLLGIPVVGSCQRAFAISRFSWAYYLTQQTGMPMRQSLTASFRATGNGAFVAATEMVCRSIEAGESLYEALADIGLFPEEFLEIVHVGETSGTVPEQLHRLSPDFQEQARRSLSRMCGAFAWVIWATVAGFIVFFVIRFFSWYVDQINKALEGIS